MEFLPLFQDRESFFELISEEESVHRKILSLLFYLFILSSVYGAIMGSYHGAAQSLAAAIKLPILFCTVLVICFPAFFIIQSILGSRLRLLQMITIILSGFVLTVSIMISFTPIVIFFLLTGGNYYFLQLLHICILGLSGFFGMKAIIDALKFSCEKKHIYPQIGVTVFKFWVIILAFVGIQLAWNLRPFLGDRGEPFQLFRNYEGNFYTAVVYSIRQLSEGNDQTTHEEHKQAPELPFSTDR